MSCYDCPFACLVARGFTKCTWKPARSSTSNAGIQYTPVDSIATSRTPHEDSHSAIDSRSCVKRPEIAHRFVEPRRIHRHVVLALAHVDPRTIAMNHRQRLHFLAPPILGEAAHRYGVSRWQLSSWRSLARAGKLAVPRLGQPEPVQVAPAAPEAFAALEGRQLRVRV